MTRIKTDICIIGGGSGGVRAARQAAATGASVALAEPLQRLIDLLVRHMIGLVSHG